MNWAKIAIFLTGVTGISVGGLVALSTLKTEQERQLVRTHETLKSESTALVDQFYSIVESAKSINPSEAGEALSYQVAHGAMKVKSGTLEGFEVFSNGDLSLQERVLDSMKSQLSLADLGSSHIGIGTYEQNETGGKLGLWIALSGAAEKEAITKFNFVLVDPAKAFPGLQKFLSSNQLAWLVSKEGRVLAHTHSAYVGADLKKIDELKPVIENVFTGANPGGVHRYTQVDGSRQLVALVRAGTYPVAFAVEEKAPAAVFSNEWFQEQFLQGSARKNLGVILILVAITLAVMAVISSWASRGLRTSSPARKGLSLEGESADTFVSKQTEKRDLIREQSRREEAVLESAVAPGIPDSLTQALARLETSYTIEGVEKELTRLSAGVTRARVLYFRYLRRAQNLSLVSVSDGVSISNFNLMQAYVRKDIELQVENLSDSGKVASLTHYGPIKKMIQAEFGNETYEAWAVTSSPEVSLQARMVGVVVLVSTRNTHASSRPLLARILRECGNFLFAQGNRIKPKGSAPLHP